MTKHTKLQICISTLHPQHLVHKQQSDLGIYLYKVHKIDIDYVYTPVEVGIHTTLIYKKGAAELSHVLPVHI